MTTVNRHAAIITNYLEWMAKYRPRDGEDRPLWPRAGRIAGYLDCRWLIQAHYFGGPQ